MAFKNFANKRGMNSINIKAKERVVEKEETKSNSVSENVTVESATQILMAEHQGSKFADIPADKISLNEHNTYRKFDNDEVIKEYAQSIDKDNLLQIITVCYDKNDSNRYVLISGERRYRAMTYLGWKTIPCWVINTTDDADARVKLHIANLKSRSATMTPSEKLESYRDLRKAVELRHNETGDTSSVTKECARIMQLSKRQAQRYSSTLRDIEALTKYGVSDAEIRNDTKDFSMNEISRYIKKRVSDFEYQTQEYDQPKLTELSSETEPINEPEKQEVIESYTDIVDTDIIDIDTKTYTEALQLIPKTENKPIISYPIFEAECNGELKQGIGVKVGDKFLIIKVVQDGNNYKTDCFVADDISSVKIIGSENI